MQLIPVEVALNIVQTAPEKMRSLPQQQQQVFNFIEFLQSKIAKQKTNQENQEPNLFLAVAQKFACRHQ